MMARKRPILLAQFTVTLTTSAREGYTPADVRRLREVLASRTLQAEFDSVAFAYLCEKKLDSRVTVTFHDQRKD